MDEIKITQKLINHRERLLTLEEKWERALTKNEFYGKMDEVMVILQRLEQERTIANHRLDRIEKQVEETTNRLGDVKENVGKITDHLGIN